MFQFIKRIKTKIKALTGFFRNPDNSHKIALCVVAAGSTVLFAGSVSAFIPVPAAGSFAFDIYDVAVNDILNGPIGFTGGVAAMAMGAMMAIQQKIALALPCLLGGALLMTADTMTTTLGAIF